MSGRLPGSGASLPSTRGGVAEDFVYQSDLNTDWLSVEELRRLAEVVTEPRP